MSILKRVLGGLWAGWKKFAHGLGVFNRWLLLTLFYWVIVDVVNLFLRLFRIDLLDRRLRAVPTYWHDKVRHTEGFYRHQF
ncbi:MAG: hypothetical protein ACE5G2_02500 [Candidatus Krumholzibacteriia bacterium]